MLSWYVFCASSHIASLPFCSLPCLKSNLKFGPCRLQVALLSGLDADGQKKLNSTKDGDHHLNKMLRLLTVRTESGRDRSGIALVGGPHDPKIDGSATQRYHTPHTEAVSSTKC